MIINNEDLSYLARQMRTAPTHEERSKAAKELGRIGGKNSHKGRKKK